VKYDDLARFHAFLVGYSFGSLSKIDIHSPWKKDSVGRRPSFPVVGLEIRRTAPLDGLVVNIPRFLGLYNVAGDRRNSLHHQQYFISLIQ